MSADGPTSIVVASRNFASAGERIATTVAGSNSGRAAGTRARGASATTLAGWLSECAGLKSSASCPSRSAISVRSICLNATPRSSSACAWRMTATSANEKYVSCGVRTMPRSSPQCSSRRSWSAFSSGYRVLRARNGW